MMGMMAHGMGYGPIGLAGMGLGLVMHVAVLALVVMGVVYLFRTMRRAGCCQSGTTDALQVLQIRYAKGEIDSEQYQKMKAELKA